MPLFVCSGCESIENTALSKGPGGWYDIAAMRARNGAPRTTALCSACITGTWHDRFPRTTYNPLTDAARVMWVPPAGGPQETMEP